MQLYAPSLCKEMGPLLAGSLLSPFLKIGLTFALVQSDGTSPVASDLSNMSWIIGAISDLRSLSTIVGFHLGQLLYQDVSSKVV